jgi:hypothetical protein
MEKELKGLHEMEKQRITEYDKQNEPIRQEMAKSLVEEFKCPAEDADKFVKNLGSDPQTKWAWEIVHTWHTSYKKMAEENRQLREQVHTIQQHQQPLQAMQGLLMNSTKEITASAYPPTTLQDRFVGLPGAEEEDPFVARFLSHSAYRNPSNRSVLISSPPDGPITSEYSLQQQMKRPRR